MTAPRWPATTLVFSLLGGACGAAPAVSSNEPPAASPTRDELEPDVGASCEERPGQPLPEPLRAEYSGVAKRARCQNEVFSVMRGVSRALGVACKHCHQEPDYAADTHNKQVANWMARELLPRLHKRARTGPRAEVWCRDCHAGRPKLLGDPRRRDVAIEWMTTHLSEAFDTLPGKPPKCRDCHGGDLGSPDFRTQIILRELPGLVGPAPASSDPQPEPEPGGS